MSVPTAPAGPARDARAKISRATVAGVASQRVTLLAALLVVLVVVMSILDSAGATSASYNADYLSSALISAVPLVLLGLAQLVVIASGRGGIDLSVGSMVSLAGMMFGTAYGVWGLPLVPSALLAVGVGGLAGALNGTLIAYVGFPALITTLATFYGYSSVALVASNQKPISTAPIQDFYSAAQSIELPLIGQFVPLVPLGVFTFLVPVGIVVWIALNRTTWGRRIYAIGTNDVAAQWAGIDTRATRMSAYVVSGVLSGLVAVYTVAQFASARPDAGNSGSGMALPAITIAVLGGVAITGGIGRVAGVVLAALLVVWLNAGILLLFPGNDGAQFQLLALGVLLIGSSLLNQVVRGRSGALS